MATVYRAFDEVANREVALKLLNKEASESSHLSALFEREFHTLTQLAHPRIIEVYDFGVDPRGAYYTMELLDGQDLRQLAPLGWKEACKLLTDVASSLSLLHSRRLLHRDVSSRNVRCTREGRAKLIDFGAMVSFGAAAKVIGTPAFIAPEALNHQPLDQRTDLYSLGALAYWLMTKRYAYRAHSMGQLQDAWRTQPLPLSVVNPDVPKALNDLVMSLLSLDRMARPSFASQVVETLGACAGLGPDDAVEVKQAYLTTPQLMGRAAVVKELRKHMLTMQAGHGGDPLLIEGPSGIGRTRLLAELVLEGKVIGAMVLTAEAEASARGDYGVVWELLEQLFENAYDLAVEIVKPHLDVLSIVLPGLSKLMLPRNPHPAEEGPGNDALMADINGAAEIAGGTNPVGSDEPALRNPKSIGDQIQIRPRVQKALLDIFLTIGQSRRLVIAIDDVHRVDEPSVALLSGLAIESLDHAFVLAVTAETGAVPVAQAAYAVLSRIARRVEVNALDLDATEGLLRSMFGEAPNLGLVADRIYGISNGNPRAVMQLTQHLVDRGVVRYQAGVWTLPASIDVRDLPGSITEALRDKVRELSAGAVELARIMALSADERFSFDECLVLAGHRDGPRITQQLHEHVASDVLRTDGLTYGLSQRSLIAVLTERSDKANQRLGHLHLAAVFEKRQAAPFRVVQHLFGAGQSERGLDLLVEYLAKELESIDENHNALTAYIQSLPRNAVDTYKYAFDLCEQLNRPKKQLFLLKCLYVFSRFNTSVENKTLLTDVMDQLYRDSGLGFYHDLSDAIEPQARLENALSLAQKRYDATAEHERVLSPAEAIFRLVAAINQAAALGALSFDYAFLESLPSVKPLLPIAPGLQMIETNVRGTMDSTSARYEDGKRHFLDVLEMISEPDGAGLNEAYRKYITVSLLFAIGMIEASVGNELALNRADAIEPDPLHQVNAWRLRMIYYLRQGDSSKAEECKKYLELLQIQNSPWQLFEGLQLFPLLLTYASYDDLIGITQMMDSLEKMAEQFVEWKPVVDYARGEYHRIRGDFAGAVVEFEKALGRTAVGRHAVWPYAAGAHLRALLGLNRLQEAKTLGFERLHALEKEGFGYTCALVEMPLALIEAKLGEEQTAEKLADRAIERYHRIGAKGVYLGLAYETRARVAVYLDDPKRFRKCAKLCAEQYRVGHNPALTAKYQKLTQDARHAYIGVSLETKRGSELRGSSSQTGELFATIQAHFARAKSHGELVDAALELITQRTGAKEGYLYLFEAGALKLASHMGDQPPSVQALESLQEVLISYSEEPCESEMADTQTEQSVWPDLISGQRAVEPVVLSAKVAGTRVPVGAVVLCLDDKNRCRPNDAFFRAVALCLHEEMFKDVSASQEQSDVSTQTRGESRYLVEVLLGEGRVSSVYKVRDRESGRLMALKRLRGEPREARHRARTAAETIEANKLSQTLRREYQALKSLAHPRIVEAYDFGVDQEGAYYTMELLEGEDLRRAAPLPWKNACALLQELASALGAVHSKGFLHRDLSPRNVRYVADGHVKLMDFGTIAPMGSPYDAAGTPPFMPPEAIYRQPLDQRSDLYCFGALAYWLLTGRHAYSVRQPSELSLAWATTPAAPSKVVAQIGTPAAAIPKALDQLVLELLSVEPSARPGSASEVLVRLIAIEQLPTDEKSVAS
jgi:serine/threonine protein kinase/tetratricopeptide (TPR) repeat protein